MIKSIRNQIVILLLLFSNTITPMKPLPMLQNIAYEKASDILMLENVINSGIVALQTVLFVHLKEKDALFGTKVIEYPDKDLYKGMTYLGFGCAYLSFYINTLPVRYIHSDLNSGITITLMLSSLMHISNLIYDDALALLKEKNKNHFEVTIKNSSKYGKCTICHNDEPDQGYVSICAQEEHIFCKGCLNGCLNLRKEKLSLEKLWCELCRKDVPRNDEKLKVTLPPQPKVTFGLWAKQVGIVEMIIYLMSIGTLYAIVHCQFS